MQAPCSFMRVAGNLNGGGFKRRLKGGRGPWRTWERVGASGNGDGRRADSILRSVQYVPICRHVLSIPLRVLLPHAARYSYLYSELCEIKPPQRVRFLSSSLFYCFLLLSVSLAHFSRLTIGITVLCKLKRSTIRFSCLTRLFCEIHNIIDFYYFKEDLSYQVESLTKRKAEYEISYNFSDRCQHDVTWCYMLSHRAYFSCIYEISLFRYSTF